MSDDTVRPALTPGEWAELAIKRAHVKVHGDGDPLWIRSAEPYETDVWVYGDERHALAALALHGQPFGFTREDVIRVLRVANDMVPGTDEQRDWVSLARRLAALLPDCHIPEPAPPHVVEVTFHVVPNGDE